MWSYQKTSLIYKKKPEQILCLLGKNNPGTDVKTLTAKTLEKRRFKSSTGPGLFRTSH